MLQYFVGIFFYCSHHVNIKLVVDIHSSSWYLFWNLKYCMDIFVLIFLTYLYENHDRCVMHVNYKIQIYYANNAKVVL